MDITSNQERVAKIPGGEDSSKSCWPSRFLRPRSLSVIKGCHNSGYGQGGLGYFWGVRETSIWGTSGLLLPSKTQRGIKRDGFQNGTFCVKLNFGKLGLRKRPPPTGVKIAKIGKRGFRGQKNPISQCPKNGRFESKNPHFSTGLHNENGDVLTQSAHFWDTGKWEFFDPETLFSRFWRF